MKQFQFPLTLFFDSTCPLCAAEMRQLAELDSESRLQFEDIYAEDFQSRFPHIDPVAADRFLHAEYADGTMVYSLDVTYAAWSAVNKKKWLAVLRWPVIRWFADIGYRVFARNRYTISYLLTGTKRCERCSVLPDSASSAE